MHSARRALLLAALGAALPVRADGWDEAWIDARRQRTLPVRLRWPPGSGPAALIVFSHGLGGNLQAGTVWAEAWREAGFAVLNLQHPGSDAGVLAEGWAALRAAASAQQLIARVLDVQFVLDEVGRRHARGDAHWARLRLDAIGMSGHSFGAQTTTALAGRRYPVPTPDLADARVRAFMAFSPSPGEGLSSSGRAVRTGHAAVHVPDRVA